MDAVKQNSLKYVRRIEKGPVGKPFGGKSIHPSVGEEQNGHSPGVVGALKGILTKAFSPSEHGRMN